MYIKINFFSMLHNETYFATPGSPSKFDSCKDLAYSTGWNWECMPPLP